MDFKLIGKLCGLGVDFAPTAAGMTRSTATGWQNIATNDKEQIKSWFQQDGYRSLVAVAKKGRAFVLDLDHVGACRAMGFKDEWLDGMFGVATPSGGQHWYGLQDETFSDFASVVNIHAVKGDRGSKKVMEIKVDRCSVAAPTAKREGQPNKKDGFYTPITTVNGHLRKGLHPDLLAWVREHMETPRPAFAGHANADWKFHPSFTDEQFLEDNDTTLHISGMLMEGTFAVVPESCPLCGREHNNSTLAAGVTKFLFSGSSYGFCCKACGVDTRDEFEARMAELHEDFDPWSQYFIYEHDDPDIVREQDEELFKRMGVEDASETGTVEIVDIPAKKQLTDGFTYEPQDTGNGERLVRKCGESIRWIAETNQWMVWGENGWCEDTKGTLMRMSKQIVDELVAEAKLKRSEAISEGGDLNSAKVREAKALLAHAKQSGRIERRKAMIASAGYEKDIHTNLNDWDSDPWLLNVANGVIELKTQTFRARTREDLLMKQSPVVYDPEAKCPLWEAAMLKWSCNDPEWVAWVQQALGISHTGDVSLQILPFCQGGGENGKDTAFTIFRHLLGTYCRDVAFQTFAETKYGHSEHRNDLAVLAGAIRMITTSESTDGHVLDEGIIKTMTGGPDSKVTSRRLYGEPFSYTPQYKPWFMSNYEPVIKGGDWGIWRRVKKIPWDYTLTPEEKDPDFAEKLKAEAPGILNWTLKGLRDLLANGKKLPACQRIEDATQQYRQEMDIVGRFTRECVESKPYHRETGKDAYKVYQDWCKSNGQYPMPSRRFHKEFQKRHGSGVRSIPGKTGLVYEGIAMKVNGQGVEMEED